MRKLNKKGVESYVAWVLLISFAVIISVFMYTWITSHVENQLTFVEESDDKEVCSDVGITITGACQNAQTLNMNLSNIKMQGISELKFRFFDIYDNIDSRNLNISIRAGESLTLDVIKQGTLKEVQIIPVTRQNTNQNIKIISCTKSMATLNNIKIC